MQNNKYSLSGININTSNGINDKNVHHLNKFKLDQILTLNQMNNPNNIMFAKSQFDNSLSKGYHLYQNNSSGKIEGFDDNATETAAPTEPSYEYNNDSGNGDTLENNIDDNLLTGSKYEGEESNEFSPWNKKRQNNSNNRNTNNRNPMNYNHLK
jgi:hypothetical protein